jgi:hypothetical protein
MLVDGVSHMASDVVGLGEGFRYTNEWLATLTENSLPGSFYRGTVLGSFNSWMRLITGVLFGIGVTWYSFGTFYHATQQAKQAKQKAEMITAKGMRGG